MLVRGGCGRSPKRKRPRRVVSAARKRERWTRNPRSRPPPATFLRVCEREKVGLLHALRPVKGAHIVCAVVHVGSKTLSRPRMPRRGLVSIPFLRSGPLLLCWPIFDCILQRLHPGLRRRISVDVQFLHHVSKNHFRRQGLGSHGYLDRAARDSWHFHLGCPAERATSHGRRRGRQLRTMVLAQ